MDEELLDEARRFASATGRTLTALIQDSLRQAMACTPKQMADETIDLPVSKGGRGLQAGVDLDDTVDLLDRMDR
ncbi:MAG: DUF2191 domain-containing protein [Vulcanimicrobiota bacterium]